MVENSPLLTHLLGAKRTLEPLSGHFRTVFELANSEEASLLEQNRQLHRDEARALLKKAKALSIMTVRQFRENRLHSAVHRSMERQPGIMALVEGPTFEDLFWPDWDQQCPPGAIESRDSHLAYFADLYRTVQALERSGTPGEALLLKDRRPDLKQLVLDHTSLNQIEPVLKLSNEILETTIRSHLDSVNQRELSVDDVLLRARFPHNLPYANFMENINYVLDRKNRLTGDPARTADTQSPYFKEPGAHSTDSDAAMLLDTSLSPQQLRLLLEIAFFPNTRSDDDAPRAITITEFLQDNFGVSTPAELQETKAFCRQTGLKTDELDSLLSVGPYRPKRSDNVIVDADSPPVDGAVFGSVYINGGISNNSRPAMYLRTDRPSNGPVEHRIEHLSLDRLDRIQRMLRLSHWLELPFEDIDRLLIAAISIEKPAVRAAKTGTNIPPVISEDTLRALGVFKMLNKNFGVTVDDYAAILGGVAVEGRGKTPSQFDQIFNKKTLFSTPLVLDGAPFRVVPESEAEQRRVDQVCATLGMNFELYLYVATAIAESFAAVAPATSLTWSRELISAFYRLVTLPRYLGLTSVECLALLALLNEGGSHWVSKVAGPPLIATFASSANTDTLSVIHAMAACVLWMREHRWSVRQLSYMLAPSYTRPVAAQAEQTMMQQISERLGAVLASVDGFRNAGVPLASDVTPSPRNRNEPITLDWLTLLAEFIEPEWIKDATGETVLNTAGGLIKHLEGDREQHFEEELRKTVTRAILGTPKRKKNQEEPALSAEGEDLLARVSNLVMRARAGQQALLLEELGSYLGVSADISESLLKWAGGSRYQLLKAVQLIFNTAEIETAAEVPIGDETLWMLDKLLKMTTLVTHLGLSPAFLAQFVGAPQWFSNSALELSISTVYFLSQYTRILDLSEHPEDRLLDYFHLVNNFMPRVIHAQGPKARDSRLIRDSAAHKLATFLNWGVREVLTVATYLNPGKNVIFTLRELNTLVQLCLLSRHTGLDAKTLLALGALRPTSSVSEYRDVADMVLSSLTEPLPGKIVGEVGQSHTTLFSADPHFLIANKPDESATLTLTLRDYLGEPYENEKVTWVTNLGVLPDDVTTETNAQGEAHITLKSGSQMGMANVVALFGLGEEVVAPTIEIGCDVTTLNFKELHREPVTALAGRLETIRYHATLVDAYDNQGIDQPVTWTTDLGEFIRPNGLSNASGKASAALQSWSPGKVGKATATLENSASATFAEVEFLDRPYFEFVRFTHTVVVGLEATVECRIVRIDGKPLEGVTVNWSSTVPDTLLDSSTKSDADGIARARFLATATGLVSIAASLPGVDARLSSAVVTVHDHPKISDDRASATHTLVDLDGHAEPVRFYLWLALDDNSPLPPYPVRWSVNGVEQSVEYTNESGMAMFTHTFTEDGDHRVRALLENTSQTFDFDVNTTVINTADIVFRIQLIPPKDVGDIGRSEILSRGSEYYLHFSSIHKQTGRQVPGAVFKIDHKSAGTDGVELVIEDSYTTGPEGYDLQVIAQDDQENPTGIFLKLDVSYYGNALTFERPVGYVLRYWGHDFVEGSNVVTVHYETLVGHTSLPLAIWATPNEPPAINCTFNSNSATSAKGSFRGAPLSIEFDFTDYTPTVGQTFSLAEYREDYHRFIKGESGIALIPTPALRTRR